MTNEKLVVATEPSPESLLGARSFVLEGEAQQSLPVATGLYSKTSACFLIQLTPKST